MGKVITYECKECGCEIIVSGSHESHLRPIYCCGVEVADVSATRKKTLAPTKKASKETPKATKKSAAKKSSGKASQKKAPARKKTSKR